MTARFISSVLRGRSSALVAVALVATAATTAQAASIFSSTLYNVTTPSGGSTGQNFQLGYGSPTAGSVPGIVNTSTGGTLGYNFVYANGQGTNLAAYMAVATESNTIGAVGNDGVVKLDSATVYDPNDTQDHGAFLALDSVYEQSPINIALSTMAGVSYTVSFDWAGTQQSINPPGGPLATTDYLTVGFTGNASQNTGTINVMPQGFSGWYQVTDTFTATVTGTSTLSFLATGTPSYVQPAFVLLDNINVASTSTPPPTIPEPNSLLLLSTGLVGLGGFVRSRFKK